MEDKYYSELVLLRMERATELLANDSYKSANNRAYYAIEKAINALLIDKHIETKTHNGALKMFNVEYVRVENAYFTDEDYRLIAKAEQIRSVSDYDDFYVASKEETNHINLFESVRLYVCSFCILFYNLLIPCCYIRQGFFNHKYQKIYIIYPIYST